MRRLVLLATVLAACGPPAYYVSNLYVDQGGQLIIERCAIDNGRNSDKPDPNNCHYDRVGSPPPEVAARLGAMSPPPPAYPPGGPAAAPPAPPAPPAQ
ncbi:MAG TPA: hypothetical protein VGF94_10660 [Kofleriaceae bacterium]|jgi:hypothetical protein